MDLIWEEQSGAYVFSGMDPQCFTLAGSTAAR